MYQTSLKDIRGLIGLEQSQREERKKIRKIGEDRLNEISGSFLTLVFEFFGRRVTL